MATVTLTSLTPEDLLEMPDGDRYELVEGRLAEKLMSMEAVWVVGRLYRKLDDFGSGQAVGTAFTDGVSFQCFGFDAELIRRPDASFIRKGRLTPEQFTAGHCRIAPDLVAEVISPTNRFNDVEERIHDFHEAGTTLVWVISPELRFVRIHRKDGSISQLKETDELTGESVLPGFRCLVSDLLPPQDPAAIL